MSIATPTILPRSPIFPHLLPKPPQPHPVPLPKHKRSYGHINAVRDLQREMDDLSDEENELEDINIFINNRGFNFLIPIGRLLTQQEEKNDADDDESDDESARSGVAPSAIEEEGDEESSPDIDAGMEDLDAEGDVTLETDEVEEIGDDSADYEDIES